MSRLPPFDPLDPGKHSPAIPAIPATRDEQNSENSRNSSGVPPEHEGPGGPEGYRLKYPEHDQATDAELADLEEQVNTTGYVLLWSNLLADFVAFYRDQSDLPRIPDCFVPYSEREIWELFGDRETDPSPNGLRLIHEAKKQGGRVLSEEEQEEHDGRGWCSGSTA